MDIGVLNGVGLDFAQGEYGQCTKSRELRLRCFKLVDQLAQIQAPMTNALFIQHHQERSAIYNV